MFTNLRLQLYYSLISLLFFGGFIWLLFLFHGPEDIVALGKIVYFEFGQKLRFPVNTVSQSTFNLIRIAYPVLLLLFGAFFIAFLQQELKTLPLKAGQLFSRFQSFMHQQLNSLNATEKRIAGLTLLLIIAERIFYLFQFPLHTDEAATYFLFIQNGAWAISSFYPIPNNHLLQNLLAWLFTFVFTEPFWILRLPPLLLSFLLIFAGFFIIKRFSDFTIAYLATALFNFGSLTLYLSTQGRGYILLTLLAVFLMALIFKALQSGKAGYWVLISITGSLGFFTVPVFAYPLAIALAFAGLYLALHRRYLAILNVGLSGFTAVSGAAVLYTPLLMVSGYKALFENKYVIGVSPELFNRAFLTFLIEVQGELFGGKGGYGIRAFLILTGCLGVIFLLQKHSVFRRHLTSNTHWLAGFCLLTTGLIYLFLRIQLVLPPPRVLFFKSFFDYLGAAIVIGLGLMFVFKNATLRCIIIFAGVLIFAGFQVFATEKFLKEYPQQYYNFPALVKQIQESDAQKVYVAEPFYQLFLEYEYARFGKKVQIENEEPERNARFDYIVIEHEKEFPEPIPDSLYQEVYKDALVRAFVLKK